MIPEQFVRALDVFESVAVGVPADRWDAPSPCEGWSAADVVDHVTGGLRGIQSLGADGRSEGGSAAGGPAAGGRAAGEDSLDRWQAARTELLAALDDAALTRQVSLPWGAQMPLGEYIGRYPLELIVHTWDLARATGQTVMIDQDLVRDALATAALFAPAGRAAGIIGPAREVAEDADDLTRLLATFGRQAT